MQEAANIKDKEVAKDDTNIDTTIKPAVFTPHTQSFHNHSTDNPCTCEVCHSSRYLSTPSVVNYSQPIMDMSQYPSSPQKLQQLQKEHTLLHDNILYTFAKGRVEDLPGRKDKVCPKWKKQQNAGSDNIDDDDEPREISSGEDEEKDGGIYTHPIYGQEYNTSTLPPDAIIFAPSLNNAALHCTGNMELWKLLVDNVVHYTELVDSPQNQNNHDVSWKKVEGTRVENIIANKEGGLKVKLNKGGGTII